MQRDCRICGHRAAHPTWMLRDLRRREPVKYEYFLCQSCWCLQIAELPRDASSLYGDDYYSLKEVSKRKVADPAIKGVLRHISARLGVAKGLHPLLDRFFSFPTHHEWFRRAGVGFRSSILDVGCGSGELLLRITKEGFSATGLEPHIRKDIVYPNGLTIKKGSMADLDEGAYDFIMLNHSMEHMPDQHEAMRQMARLLRAGGVALVRVPVGTCQAWEDYGENWVQLDPPLHLYLHSEESIKVLASESGFEVFDTVYDSWEFQFVGSELCRLGVPIQEHKDYMRQNKPFTEVRLREFRERARELNKARRGDMACFYLRKKEGEEELPIQRTAAKSAV